MAVNQIGISTDWIERVKELMDKNGLSTYTDLAFKSGLSAGSLNQAMRGMHMPRQSTIDKIAEALDSTPQYLLYGDTMKAVHQIPLLEQPEMIKQWVAGEELDTRDISFVEAYGNARLKLNSFAVVYKQRDMEPMYLYKDILFFEPVTSGDEIPNDEVILIIRSDKHMLIGKFVRANNGQFLESVNEKYPPVLIEDSDVVVGIAVQMIRNMKD